MLITSMGNTIDDIRDYGDSILLKKEQEVAAYDAMANATLSLVDTLGMSDARVK
jgi:hypothetical protein